MSLIHQATNLEIRLLAADVSMPQYEVDADATLGEAREAGRGRFVHGIGGF
jgi:hypothetical protein